MVKHVCTAQPLCSQKMLGSEKKRLLATLLLRMFEFMTDKCVSDRNERIRSIQIDKNFITII